MIGIQFLIAVRVAEPLGLGIVAICITGIVLSLLRYGRRGIALTSLCATGIVLGLIAADLRLGEREPANIVLVDTSASVAPLMRREWPQGLREEIIRLSASGDDPCIVMFFDGSVHRVIDNPRNLPEDFPQSADPLRSRPQLFHAALPEDVEAGQIVVVSDWAFHNADLDELLANINADRVLALPLPSRIHDPARVLDVQAPHRVDRGQGFRVTVLVAGNVGTTATITIEAGDAPPEVQLQPLTGEGVVPVMIGIPSSATSRPGLLPVTIRLSSNGEDDLPGNNQWRVFVMVGDQAPMLYASGPHIARENDPLWALLIASGYPVVRARSALELEDALGLGTYSTVVLNDVPITMLPERGDALARACAKYGVGVIVAGATQSWGPGGYNGSPLERVLPLDSNPEPERARHHVLLLDASASMGERNASGTRFDQLREAVAHYLGALDREDQVLLLPFSSSIHEGDGTFTVMTSAHRAELLGELATYVPGGETAIHAPLMRALALLPTGDDMKRAKLVLISDGQNSADGATSFSDAGAALAASGAELLVMLIGDAIQPWVEQLQQTGGSSVKVARVADWAGLVAELARILDEEQNALLHDEAAPVRLDPTVIPYPVNPGVAIQPMPRRVDTAPRMSALVPLMVDGDKRAPLIGLLDTPGTAGRSVGLAFSCDGAGSALATDAELQKLVAGAVQWVLAKTPQTQAYRLDARRDGERLALTMSAPITADDLRALKGTVVLDDREIPVSLAYVGPRDGESHWQGEVAYPLDADEVHFQLMDQHGQRNGPMLVATVPYPDELAPPLDRGVDIHSPAHRVLDWGTSTLGSIPGEGTSITSPDTLWALGFALLFGLALTLWLRRRV